ncbi:MAG: hypothetical protein V7746_16845 [Halioglobus sp.]
MSDQLFSRFWPRISHLKPMLQPQVQAVRQTFRGEEWIVLQDQASGQHHRLSTSAYFFVSLMNGERSLEEIWRTVLEKLDSDVPDQGELLQLLTMLYRADLLNLDELPDFDELAERIEKRRVMERKRLGNPLSIRLPLWNPDRFLTRTYPLVKWVFTPWAAFAYLLLLVSGLVQLGLHWETISGSLSDRLLAAESWIPLFFTYPLVKLLHELGHGYTVKHWGGHVRQLGVMLLVFFPVPYVDASDSASFPDKRQRALVGAAGILVELGIAVVALMLWSKMEPGFVRALLFNVMVLSGISTLLFNGNPLLRFDGYYVFSDLIEVPNLGTRGGRYFRYVLAHCLGVKGVTSPANDPVEARWLLGYAILSFCYRLTVMTTIALLLINNYFVVGALLAIWVLFSMILSPIFKGIWYLYDNPQLEGWRGTALLKVTAAFCVLLAFVLLMPMPHSTTAQGVVWLPEEALVRAEVDGRVSKVAAKYQGEVPSGHPVLSLDNPLTDNRVRQLQTTLEEMKLQRRSMAATDRSAMKGVEEQIIQVQANLEDARREQASLQVVTKRSGFLVLPNPRDTAQRYVFRGDTIAYVLPRAAPTIRVVVPENRIDMVRNQLVAVSVRPSWDLGESYRGELLREVPAATNALPSPAFTVEGGGEWIPDPSARNPLTSIEPIFVIDLAIPGAPQVTDWAGARVHVRFDHGFESVGDWLWRFLRLLFLRELNV